MNSRRKGLIQTTSPDMKLQTIAKDPQFPEKLSPHNQVCMALLATIWGCPLSKWVIFDIYIYTIYIYGISPLESPEKNAVRKSWSQTQIILIPFGGLLLNGTHIFLSNLTYWKNLTWQLKSSSLTRFEIHRKNVKEIWGECATLWQRSFQLLLSSLQPGIAFSTLDSRAFFDCVSRGQNDLCWETVFSLCLLTLLFPPLPIHLQSKENKFGIWSPMTGLDVRCRSGCRSPPTWNTLKTVEAQN
jgi:hypothetical protein